MTAQTTLAPTMTAGASGRAYSSPASSLVYSVRARITTSVAVSPRLAAFVFVASIHLSDSILERAA
jgi:hypothetical protein